MILLDTVLETRLQQSAHTYHSVVPFDGRKDALTLIDFTEANDDLSEQLLANTDAFTQYIQTTIKGSTYGIGGYNEHRTIYSRSSVFDAKGRETEPRRLHLGIDIWGKVATPVFAPLGGVIHSYGFNDKSGDYGATIILMHQLYGEKFHTLYGHLSIADLSNLEEGKYISRGEILGHFGEPFENGNWPPHLHFQIIKDMWENRGDFPGVCRYSERKKYLDNSPDPDLILQMLRYTEHR